MTSERTCDICGDLFVAKAHNAKRCSPKCVSVYRLRWMNAHHVKVPVRVVDCSVCGKPHELTPKASIKSGCSEACREVISKRRFRRYWKSPKGKAISAKFDRTEKGKARNRRWREKNGKAYIEKKRKDPEFRLIASLRSRISNVVRQRKPLTTTAYLGCSATELRAHLERQFKPGMAWSNYGRKGWHVDHRKPLAAFEFFTADGGFNESALSEALHFSNLQPLWYWENCSKADKLVG